MSDSEDVNLNEENYLIPRSPGANTESDPEEINLDQPEYVTPRSPGNQSETNDASYCSSTPQSPAPHDSVLPDEASLSEHPVEAGPPSPYSGSSASSPVDSASNPELVNNEDSLSQPPGYGTPLQDEFDSPNDASNTECVPSEPPPVNDYVDSPGTSEEVTITLNEMSDDVAQAEYNVSIPNDNVAQAEYDVSIPNDSVAQAEYDVSIPNDNVAQAEYDVLIPNENVTGGYGDMGEYYEEGGIGEVTEETVVDHDIVLGVDAQVTVPIIPEVTLETHVNPDVGFMSESTEVSIPFDTSNLDLDMIQKSLETIKRLQGTQVQQPQEIQEEVVHQTEMAPVSYSDDNTISKQLLIPEGFDASMIDLDMIQKSLDIINRPRDVQEQSVEVETSDVSSIPVTTDTRHPSDVDGGHERKQIEERGDDESDFEGFDDDSVAKKKSSKAARVDDESDFEGFEEEKDKNTSGRQGDGDESDFEGFEKEPAESNMNGIIANIFGESDEEEDFEGFAENEVEKAAQKEEGEGETEGEPASKKPKKDDGGSSSSDEGVTDDLTALSDFDAMMARQKLKRQTNRKRGRNVDIINDSDDKIMETVERMKMAAREDRELVLLNQPATKKLSMLTQVIELIKKVDLRAALIDCGIMRGVTEWLSPLPDKSLPCLPIRRALLNSLLEFPSLHSEVLKDSGIGKAVMYLLKHPKENRQNKETATKLINDWSRPIFNLTSNYKNLTKEEREQRDYDNLPKRRNIDSEAAPKRDLNKEMEEKRGLRPGDPSYSMRARVPQPSNKDYVVRPKSNVDNDGQIMRDGEGDGDEAMEVNRRPRGSGGGKKESTRVEKLKRNIQQQKDMGKKINRAVPISLEGRKMSL